jgi:hypothetical protein
MRKTAPNLLSLLQLISGLLAIFAIVLISLLLFASAIGILGSPNSLRLLSITVASIFVIHSVLSLWDFAPGEQKALAQGLWKARASWLFESRTLSAWPVVLVLLTSLLGVSEWFPTTGPDRPILLAAIGLVATYGFVREAREKQKNLLAFANEARDRFAEVAKQIHEERDREIEERERSAAIDRLVYDLENNYSDLKKQAEFLRVPFRDLVDTSELRAQLNAVGFAPTDEEFGYILSRLDLDEQL